MSDEIKVIFVESLAFGGLFLLGLILYEKMNYPKSESKKDI